MGTFRKYPGMILCYPAVIICLFMQSETRIQHKRPLPLKNAARIRPPLGSFHAMPGHAPWSIVMPQQSNPFAEDFIDQIISSMSFSEGMGQYARFLSERTGAEDVLLYGVRLHDNTLGVLYKNSTQAHVDFVMHVRKKLAFENIQKLFIKGAAIYIDNDVNIDSCMDYYIHSSSVKYQSIMTLYLTHIPDSNIVYAFTLASQKKKLFTPKHIQLLNMAAPNIRRSLEKLLREEGRYERTSKQITETDSMGLLTACPDLHEILRDIQVIAPLKNHVLIHGPTGSGKELMAETIHKLSGRKGKLIKVNCGAISDSLLSSEFFGHEKGSFTGAVARRYGAFEEAEKGTLFLDEIGELSPPAQVLLLRVLEQREITRVGSTASISVDVRIVAATHRNLKEEVLRKTFREDLWYRLSAFVLNVPPLAHRKGDIPGLVRYFYANVIKEMGIVDPPALTQDFIYGCTLRPWPGNVRQLRNFVERSLVYSVARRYHKLSIATLESHTFESEPVSPREMTKEDILAALESSGGRIQGPSGAASILNLAPSSLRNKMKKLGIPLPREKKRASSRS